MWVTRKMSVIFIIFDIISLLHKYIQWDLETHPDKKIMYIIYYYDSPSFSSFDIRILKLFLYVTTAIPDKGLTFKFKNVFW